MSAAEIIESLEKLGGEPYKKTLLRHGAREPLFGVKIEELKKIQKREKKNHALAMELYASGNYDAQYLAGLIADESKMSKADLKRWIKSANCATLCDYIVASVA